MNRNAVLARGLLFNDGDIECIRKKTSLPRYQKVWREISRLAGMMIKNKSINLDGDSFSIWYYVRQRLLDLALYTLITEDKGGVETVEIVLEDLCSRDFDFWQGPHYPNRPRTITWRGKEVFAGELETAQLVMGIVLACDWTWKYLSAGIRETVRKKLEEIPLMLLRNSIRFQSETWVMNHLCVLSSAMVLVVLFLGRPREDLDLAKRGLELWLEKIEEDGSYGESYHYWAYPVNCLAFGVLALKHCCNEDVPGIHRAAKCLPWAIYNQVGKYKIDGYDEPVATAVNNYDSPFLFQMEAPELLIFSRYFKLPLAGWYINNFLLHNPPRPDCLHHHWHRCDSMLLAMDDPEGSGQPPEELKMPLAAWFAETGFVYIRDSWKNCGESEGGTVFSLQSGGGGRSCSHEHYDKNSYSLFYKGEYFICDPGHSCYRGKSHHEYDTGTSSHNTVSIGGKNQSLSFLEKGMLFDEAKRHTSFNNQAVIRGKNFQEDIAYVASDASRCYTPALKQFIRRVWYVRPRFFLIWDRLDASNHSEEALNGFNINNYDGRTNVEIQNKRLIIKRPLASLQMEYLHPEYLNFRQEDAKLHLAYHVFPDMPVEGKFGSALRFTPELIKGNPNKTDYIYILRPFDGQEGMVRVESASITKKEGLIDTFDFTVVLEEKRFRFCGCNGDVYYEGAGGEKYIF